MKTPIAACALALADALSPGCGPPSASNPVGGSGPDFALQRAQMTRVQLAAPGRNIRGERVLRAMGAVPRHLFVPEDLRNSAYEDRPLPIGYGQTISQPYIVAFMTEALDPQPTDRILEIGSGSGYQAAVLSLLAAHVYSMEIVAPLAERARVTLGSLGYTNVSVRFGDGYQGWAEAAPFDAIIVTCAPNHVPLPLVRQLKPGGRMIIPVGDPPDQALYLLEKGEEDVRQRAVLPVRFVPMTGEAITGHRPIASPPER